jgi:hypothetical protein
MSLRLLTSYLIQVRNWTVSTGLSVFTELENVRTEPTNCRSLTSDQQIFLTPDWVLLSLSICRDNSHCVINFSNPILLNF